ncbi:Uncharacterized conserved protein [Plasmopara halstedii]|uniref:Uncharacterized conserved protein n=1 Tax=Plasmopara halstedii TaxID=4781 RepID=A0A0P1A876_PLAHL|nr:Uncharacterized conserved protein [Plasmopara halstedii]CEG36878.1 Uncharacterized conserved protein [Plasmopara halstedii]|eukprot:XP_024573247.1 Uncharacterized conserved protein [Plasmopara halstedii]
MDLLLDCQELRRRGLLSQLQLQEYESILKSTSSPPDDICKRLSSILVQEMDAIIECVRVQSNQQKQGTIDNSDLTALAVGGALGALNAWMWPTSSLTATNKTTSLWASAYDGAIATLNVAKRKRRVQQLQLKLLSGNVATSSHVVFCINGFMTQSDDPLRNWRVWIEDDKDAAVFAVQWEAGDVAAWNEFCSHVNDTLDSSSVSSMVAHFTENPWHSAQGKAEQVGMLLAQMLSQRPVSLRGRKISMFGHSLGGAVIYNVFQELARIRSENKATELPQITNAVSFAGAFIPDTQGLDNVMHGLDPIEGKFVNVYSTRDGVLSKLFWALQLPVYGGYKISCATSFISK